MARTEVASVVEEILEAFRNGLNIIKTTGRRHRRRHSEPANTNEEKRLNDSLALRPQEIEQAYAQSVVRHGRQFEIGDSASQSSLAQILLVLNTGLIRLLNNALSSDHKAKSRSRRGLYNLSESAAMDTLNALSALNIRLISASNLDLRLPGVPHSIEEDKTRKTRSRAQSCDRSGRRPLVSPLLQGGAWVRSKSDPSGVSVVSPAKSKKLAAKKKPNTRSADARPSKETAYATSEHMSPPPKYTSLATKAAPSLKPKPEQLQARSGLTTVQEENLGRRQPIRHPSMYIVPSDFFDVFSQPSNSFQQSQVVGTGHTPASPPPMVPLHTRPKQRYHQIHDDLSATYEGRFRPPSIMTFMTASTKIGEIPEHRLPDRELTEAQQEATPMPYVVPAMLETQKKRGGRGLKFWKKDKHEKSALDAVYA